MAYLGSACPSVRWLRFFILAAFFFVLVVITFIDLDHKLILDKITYPSIPIFYGLGLLLPGDDWKAGLVGAVVGYGVVRLIADGYYFLTRREGMGYGDGKLLALVGAFLGWRAVVVSSLSSGRFWARSSASQSWPLSAHGQIEKVRPRRTPCDM